MKHLLLALSLLTISFLTIGQNNLVPNSSFDLPVKGKAIKTKNLAEIESAKDWYSPSEPKADLYTKNTKSELVSIPMNTRGREEAENGCCYAGFLAYSYKSKDPRTYVQTKLIDTLEAGAFYCVSFNVSLSDLSKFGVNNIGAVLSKEKIDASKIKTFKTKPQILQYKNKIMEDQYIWEDVCNVFRAEGGEQYITIGNFAKDDDVLTKKLKKSRAFTKPQTTDAYYYLEDVKVIKADTAVGCKCKSMNIEKAEMEVVVRKWESGNVEENPELLVELKTIEFASKAKVLDESAKKTLNDVAKIIAAKPDLKIEVIGQTDYMEELMMSKAKVDLSKKRVEVVADALVAAGVNRANLTLSPLKSTLSTKTKDEKLLKNDRKVYFKIIKK